ncbi:kynurenine--oxoglutarate transaminase 1-like [Nelusetta ayraudi]|uniref:kynurenine--oxoglutarate transaminase 1-like n=1 Tax=Nelusetta ayraudi TaxID=303726 RepID=UPI003F7064B3
MSAGLRAECGDGEKVWNEITQLAESHRAVNLHQGVPDFSPPKFLVDAFCRAASGGPMMHQYTRPFGHLPLVRNLAKFFSRVMEREIDPLQDILVTVGAYHAVFCALQALIAKGDEVIVIEPHTECHRPMVTMAGGKPVYVPLRPRNSGSGALSSGEWVLSAEELASKFTPRTKAIVINTPNNPLGKVYKMEELQMIADLCTRHDVLCVSDETYEWLTYDDARHVRIASLPGMWERTVTIGSGGKSFSATGWKVGWAMGCGNIITLLKAQHQLSVFDCATAAQEAVAQGFQREYELFGRPESYFQQLPAVLFQKRDRLASSLKTAGFKPIMPEGGYYLTADISCVNVDLGDQGSGDESYDSRFVKWLTKDRGLAAIPVSLFFSPEHRKSFDKYVRFCFVKEDSTLDAAVDILEKWGDGE